MKKTALFFLAVLLTASLLFVSCKQDPAPSEPSVPEPTTYTVSFDANGGTGTMEAKTVDIGSPITLPRGTFTSADGKQFVGWNTKSDYTGDIYTDEEKFVPTGDLTLYAQWVAANTFKVTDGALSKGTGFNTNKLKNNLAVPKYIGDATVTSIAPELFYGCSLIRKVSIPDSVVSLGQSAFESCVTLTSIKLPSSLKTIANYVFRGCNVLEDISLPDSLTSIGEYAFRACYLLKTIVIPNSVISIGTGVFEACQLLESVTLPATITVTPDWLFSSCSSLTHVVFKGKLTKIGDRLFNLAISIETITVPSTVTNIGKSAFYGANSLTAIYVEAEVPPALGNDLVFTNTNNAPIYVPAASLETYKAAEYWSAYAERIQAMPDVK